MGETPSYLAELEVNGKSIGKQQVRIDATKVKKIMRTHPEMTIEVIKKLPYILNDPILVLDSKTVKGSLVLFGEVYANGKPVMMALEINPTTRSGKSTYVDVIKVASAYTRSNTQNMINTSSIRFISENKSRVNNWLKVNRLQLPLPNTQSNSATYIIHQNSEKNNLSDENSSKKLTAGKFSLSPSEDIGPVANVKKDGENLDFEAEKEYNRNDLYTATDDFVRDVDSVDRHSFARSLANKTSGMSGGDSKTIHIYCRDKVYTFVANGYMKGYVLMSESTEEFNAKKRSFEQYYENNIDSNRTVVSLWSQPISNQSGRQVGDALFSSGRRGPAIDDSFSKDSSDSTRAGYNERVRENTYSEEEIDEIIRKLKEMYGISDNNTLEPDSEGVENAESEQALTESSDINYLLFSNDLYTATDEFVKEVTVVDRHSFARSLANKTSGMSDGKIKTIYIYCRERVYTFVANGYMKGYISMSKPVEKLNVRKRRFAEYYENNIDSNRTTVSLLSQPISNQSGRQVDNAWVSSGRRGPVIDDSFSKDSSDSTRAGYNERERKNTYSEEEVDEIIRKLKEMYGISDDNTLEPDSEGVENAES